MSNEPSSATLEASLSRRLGRHAAELDITRTPVQVRERVQSCLLYNTAVALAGYDPDAAPQRAIAAVHDAPGDATVWVEGARRSPADAAAINAGMVTARGQNDTQHLMNGHLGCMLVPAVVALAEARRVSRATLLSALLAGYEVAPRLALGAADRTTARGLRGTSLYGVFGVAAAAARVIGLDAAGAAHALSLAAQSAGGLLQCYAEGTPEWRWQVASATRSGIIAALLAEQGLTAAAGALDGDHGFYAAYAGGPPDPGENASLGEWAVNDLTFKPYPGCAINQSPVFQLLEALRRQRFAAADTARIDLYLHPADAAYPGITHYGPFGTPGAAIMSAPFMLCLALETGAVRHRDFHERHGDDAIHARSRLIEVHTDATVPRLSSRLEIRTRAGAHVRIEPSERDPLIFDWEQTRVLAGTLAQEWPGPVPERRLQALVRYIRAEDDHPGNAMELARILTVTEQSGPTAMTGAAAE